MMFQIDFLKNIEHYEYVVVQCTQKIWIFFFTFYSENDSKYLFSGKSEASENN